MPFTHLEVLGGVERRHAFHPRMYRVRGDDVELIRARHDEVAGVVVDHGRSRVSEHVLVFFTEERVRLRWDYRFKLTAGDVFYLGMNHESPGGNARTESHHENG